MDRQGYWEQIYATKSLVEVSWYRPHLEDSLAWIDEVAPQKDAVIIDIGGGTSTLVDDLYARGYRNLSLLEISPMAIAATKARLGASATQIGWIEGDVTNVELPEARFDVWHDRAVFHFLTQDEDRLSYRRQLLRSLKPGGSVILATFSSNGPERCSGLPVRRYSPQLIAQQFEPVLVLEKSLTVAHKTPGGGIQEFTYCRLLHTGA
ncbi:MAG: class I SAM-dependent methyltransferase [Acidobacteriota bacterium]|nr:class I SAM-dependent methyltransferase [Acidobacteriota bacterium]